jgi:flagellar biosynthetic protein FlhB
VALLLLVVFLAAVIDVPLQAFFFKSTPQDVATKKSSRSTRSPTATPSSRAAAPEAREIADRASVTAVPKADFVVMNPTHYAVALKYDEATMSAHPR